VIDVALATCRVLPEADDDEALVLAALRDRGLDARMLAWDDDDAPFHDARITVLRSTWNYAWHADAFRAWLRRTAEVTTLVNPLAVVEWNLHKRYLLDLEAAGVPTVPTELVARQSGRTLRDVVTAHGWVRAIVKPAISCASRLTLAVDESNLAAGEQHLRDVSAHEDVLVQPYQDAVEDYGERSIVWIDGEITHAIRKSRRLHGDHESVAHVAIDPHERDLALRAVAAVEGEVLYARVDMVPGPDGEPRIMELELIEPSLFFDHSARALERFARAIARQLGWR
jgi:glutathione synthase/RimK-type ligase-like ATP-grasp enzyme